MRQHASTAPDHHPLPLRRPRSIAGHRSRPGAGPSTVRRAGSALQSEWPIPPPCTAVLAGCSPGDRAPRPSSLLRAIMPRCCRELHRPDLRQRSCGAVWGLFRRAWASVAVAVLVAVFPANLQMALDGDGRHPGHGPGRRGLGPAPPAAPDDLGRPAVPTRWARGADSETTTGVHETEDDLGAPGSAGPELRLGGSPPSRGHHARPPADGRRGLRPPGRHAPAGPGHGDRRTVGLWSARWTASSSRDRSTSARRRTRCGSRHLRRRPQVSATHLPDESVRRHRARQGHDLTSPSRPPPGCGRRCSTCTSPSTGRNGSRSSTPTSTPASTPTGCSSSDSRSRQRSPTVGGGTERPGPTV